MDHPLKKRGVLVYLPEEFHRRLKAKAALAGTSVSAMIEEAARKAHPDAALDSSFEIREPSTIYTRKREAGRSRRRQK
jgi:hypothetical protein